MPEEQLGRFAGCIIICALICLGACIFHRTEFTYGLNSKNPQVIAMCESLERKDAVRPELPYDLEEPEDVTRSLMKLSELSLHDFLASEPDIYTDKDLKVRYR